MYGSGARNPASIDVAVIVQKAVSAGLIMPSTRPKVTRFSVNSIANIETRLIAQAVRAAAFHTS